MVKKYTFPLKSKDTKEFRQSFHLIDGMPKPAHDTIILCKTIGMSLQSKKHLCAKYQYYILFSLKCTLNHKETLEY